MKTALLVVLGAGLLAAALVAVGVRRWSRATDALLARLERARVAPSPALHDRSELDGLPGLVRRYFRAALPDGHSVVAGARVEHEGTFNMSETGERWRAFTSSQQVVTDRPGFLWDGRIAMAPGPSVRVHDAYVAGEGVLRASLFGLIPVAHLQDRGGEVARGELMRFFAEAAWYPTALRPGQGVRWTAVDDASADATLTDGDLTLTLRFHFGDDGLVRSMRAGSRGRTLGGEVVPTPWEGAWDAYEERDGMLVPTVGEVAWLPAEGRRPYWRGRITRVEYRY